MSPHMRANNSSTGSALGRTQIRNAGATPLDTDSTTWGRISQPRARLLISAAGWPGPIGTTSAGGSGLINPITGFNENNGRTSCSGSPMVTTACTQARSP